MAKNIAIARVTVRGVRPLLWHHFGPDTLSLERKERKGVAGNDPTEWQKTVLFDRKTRQLYLTPAYPYGCLVNAAKYLKRGKRSMMSDVAATLQILDDRVWVDRFLPEELTTDPEEPVYLDVRSVRNPSTRQRNVRYRVAASPGWRTSWTQMWDITMVSRNEMQAILLDAGRFVGLGDGRAIGFGRFVIESFEEVSNAQEEVAEGALAALATEGVEA